MNIKIFYDGFDVFGHRVSREDTVTCAKLADAKKAFTFMKKNNINGFPTNAVIHVYDENKPDWMFAYENQNDRENDVVTVGYSERWNSKDIFKMASEKAKRKMYSLFETEGE